jgi:hypothetical protein
MPYRSSQPQLRRTLRRAPGGRAAARQAANAALESLERRICMTAAYSPAVNYNVPSSPDFVTSADFNLDGKRDLVVSSYSGGGLSLMLGNGNGTFQNPTSISASTAPDFVTSADLNGDGFADLITANFDNNTVSIFRGNGNGTFQTAVSYAAGNGPRAVHISDLNGDGNLDLAVAKSFEKKLTVLMGNGNCTFQTAITTTLTIVPSDITCGDFDQDGDSDLMIADFFGDKVTLLRNNGSGIFTANTGINVGTGPTSIAAGDFNGDGRLDVATSNYLTNNISVLLGTGSGAFAAAVSYAAGAGATYVIAQDADGDGRLDLIVANTDANTVSVLCGNANGTFQSATAFATGVQPRSLTSADFDGNGAPDLAVANQGAATVSVLLSGATSSVPVANPGGPYSVGEAGSVQLNGNNSSGTGLSYSWDLDGDGIFGETGAGATRGTETGATPTFSAAGLDGPTTRTVSLRVTDSNSATSTASATINVNNVAPTLTISGANSVNEGSSYTLNLASSDPGSDTIASWLITWGDGSTQTVSGNPSSVTHTFADSGSRTITATATDEDGTHSSNSKSVTVNNVAPTLTVSGPNSGNEGSAYSLTLTESDPGTDTITRWVITWGDGSTQTINANPSSVTHTYADNGSYTITATATDEDGTYSSNSKAVSIINVAPTLTISGANSGNEGTGYTLNLAESDPGADTISQWVINWGDGSTQTVTGNPANITHSYADQGAYSISATATDEDGSYSANTKSVTINNIAPTLTLGGPSTGSEGTAYTLTLSESDPGADTITQWIINWGDGSSQTINADPSSATHTYADNASYTITATATDEDGTYSSNSKAVTINNVAPTLTLSGANSGNEGASYTLSLAESDPGADTISQWVINWGDGSTQTVTGNPSSVTHTFADSGNRTISATATDEDGTHAANSKSVTVNNVAPTLTISGANSVNEGSSYALSLASSDPGSDTITSWLINWGDGSTQTVNGNPSSVTHTYADSGSRTTTATATDEDGTYSSNSKAVSIINVAPTLTIGGSSSGNEGTSYALTLSESDPGADTISQWVINWGDGSSQTVSGNPSSVTHAFADNGAYSISATATDEDGTYSSNSKSVTVNNVDPSLEISGSPAGATGVVYTLDLSSSDPGNDTISGWVIDWGDGTVDAVIGDPTTATHTYQTIGDFTISATASDEDGAYSAGSLTVNVMGSDTTHPTATFSGAPAVPGEDEYLFQVTYDDNVGINLSFLDNNDILVTGPNGFSELATFVSVSKGDGATQIATYRITAPGGTWDLEDNGVYTVAMRASQVRDTTGNSVRAGSLGTFQCAVVAADSAGNTTSTGRSMGTILPGTVRVAEDYVGAVDRNDYYRITVTTTISLSVKLLNLADNADLYLYDNSGNRLAYSVRSGTTDESITIVLQPGTYFVRVLYPGSGGTTYRLRFAGSAVVGNEPPSDNTLDGARDLGTLQPGSVSAVEDYVGADDRNDYVRFTITQPTKIYLKLYELTDNADLQLLDASGQRIAYSYRTGAATDTIQITLEPGVYYARVFFTGAVGTSYRLRLELD